ncbi:MAG: type I restriction enzyme HsdR N-terminal domain-containing protein [Desulforegulaceae bacterium]|nr:type I restriction enzyme HsdR N-terminal domain-containing protein [Desulforegulaceae bacterium]
MNSHHLILGELKDFITGETIEDNHDERYRQKIARLLVYKKGYNKNNIIKNNFIFLEKGKNRFKISIDYTVYIDDIPMMIVKYGPGSIVSRHMSAISSARLMGEYEIPVSVATNGEDAETIDTASGKTISTGLDGILSKQELAKIIVKRKITDDIRQKAEKILFAFDVDGRCPCDNSICSKSFKD